MTSYREVIFQLILHCVVFVFFVFERHKPVLEPYKVAYFLNYSLAAFVINYYLLPRFLYLRKYIWFALGALLVTLVVIFMEELIWEQVFFPDTRGRAFPGSIYSLIHLVPLIAILSGFKFAWDALQIKGEVEKLRSAAVESELQFLKMQINPHFLFNNLNNLYAYAVEGSPKTPSIILELSGVLRYMLYDCKEEYVRLSKEVENMESFTRLNQLQIENRGEVSFHSRLGDVDYYIAPLILIVFIENAFKHSQSGQAEAIRIDIELDVTDQGSLSFVCANNYASRQNNAHIPHGIGLENVRKRLQLLYPGAHDLQIKEEGSNFSVQLKLQLQDIATS